MEIEPIKPNIKPIKGEYDFVKVIKFLNILKGLSMDKTITNYKTNPSSFEFDIVRPEYNNYKSSYDVLNKSSIDFRNKYFDDKTWINMGKSLQSLGEYLDEYMKSDEYTTLKLDQLHKTYLDPFSGSLAKTRKKISELSSTNSIKNYKIYEDTIDAYNLFIKRRDQYRDNLASYYNTHSGFLESVNGFERAVSEYTLIISKKAISNNEKSKEVENLISQEIIIKNDIKSLNDNTSTDINELTQLRKDLDEKIINLQTTNVLDKNAEVVQNTFIDVNNNEHISSVPEIIAKNTTLKLDEEIRIKLNDVNTELFMLYDKRKSKEAKNNINKLTYLIKQYKELAIKNNVTLTVDYITNLEQKITLSLNFIITKVSNMTTSIKVPSTSIEPDLYYDTIQYMKLCVNIYTIYKGIINLTGFGPVIKNMENVAIVSLETKYDTAKKSTVEMNKIMKIILDMNEDLSNLIDNSYNKIEKLGMTNIIFAYTNLIIKINYFIETFKDNNEAGNKIKDLGTLKTNVDKKVSEIQTKYNSKEINIDKPIIEYKPDSTYFVHYIYFITRIVYTLNRELTSESSYNILDEYMNNLYKTVDKYIFLGESSKNELKQLYNRNYKNHVRMILDKIVNEEISFSGPIDELIKSFGQKNFFNVDMIELFDISNISRNEDKNINLIFINFYDMIQEILKNDIIDKKKKEKKIQDIDNLKDISDAFNARIEEKNEKINEIVDKTIKKINEEIKNDENEIKAVLNDIGENMDVIGEEENKENIAQEKLTGLIAESENGGGSKELTNDINKASQTIEEAENVINKKSDETNNLVNKFNDLEQKGESYKYIGDILKYFTEQKPPKISNEPTTTTKEPPSNEPITTTTTTKEPPPTKTTTTTTTTTTTKEPPQTTTTKEPPSNEPKSTTTTITPKTSSKKYTSEEKNITKHNEKEPSGGGGGGGGGDKDEDIVFSDIEYDLTNILNLLFLFSRIESLKIPKLDEQKVSTIYNALKKIITDYKQNKKKTVVFNNAYNFLIDSRKFYNWYIQITNYRDFIKLYKVYMPIITDEKTIPGELDLYNVEIYLFFHYGINDYYDNYENIRYSHIPFDNTVITKIDNGLKNVKTQLTSIYDNIVKTIDGIVSPENVKTTAFDKTVSDFINSINVTSINIKSWCDNKDLTDFIDYMGKQNNDIKSKHDKINLKINKLKEELSSIESTVLKINPDMNNGENRYLLLNEYENYFNLRFDIIKKYNEITVQDKKLIALNSDIQQVIDQENINYLKIIMYCITNFFSMFRDVNGIIIKLDLVDGVGPLPEFRKKWNDYYGNHTHIIGLFNTYNNGNLTIPSIDTLNTFINNYNVGIIELINTKDEFKTIINLFDNISPMFIVNNPILITYIKYKELFFDKSGKIIILLENLVSLFKKYLEYYYPGANDGTKNTVIYITTLKSLNDFGPIDEFFIKLVFGSKSLNKGLEYLRDFSDTYRKIQEYKDVNNDIIEPYKARIKLEDTMTSSQLDFILNQKINEYKDFLTEYEIRKIIFIYKTILIYDFELKEKINELKNDHLDIYDIMKSYYSGNANYTNMVGIIANYTEIQASVMDEDTKNDIIYNGENHYLNYVVFLKNIAFIIKALICDNITYGIKRSINNIYDNIKYILDIMKELKVLTDKLHDTENVIVDKDNNLTTFKLLEKVEQETINNELRDKAKTLKIRVMDILKNGRITTGKTRENFDYICNQLIVNIEKQTTENSILTPINMKEFPDIKNDIEILKAFENDLGSFINNNYNTFKDQSKNLHKRLERIRELSKDIVEKRIDKLSFDTTKSNVYNLNNDYNEIINLKVKEIKKITDETYKIVSIIDKDNKSLQLIKHKIDAKLKRIDENLLVNKKYEDVQKEVDKLLPDIEANIISLNNILDKNNNIVKENIEKINNDLLNLINDISTYYTTKIDEYIKDANEWDEKIDRNTVKKTGIELELTKKIRQSINSLDKKIWGADFFDIKTQFINSNCLQEEKILMRMGADIKINIIRELKIYQNKKNKDIPLTNTIRGKIEIINNFNNIIEITIDTYLTKEKKKEITKLIDEKDKRINKYNNILDWLKSVNFDKGVEDSSVNNTILTITENDISKKHGNLTIIPTGNKDIFPLSKSLLIKLVKNIDKIIEDSKELLSLITKIDNQIKEYKLPFLNICDMSIKLLDSLSKPSNTLTNNMTTRHNDYILLLKNARNIVVKSTEFTKVYYTELKSFIKKWDNRKAILKEYKEFIDKLLDPGIPDSPLNKYIKLKIKNLSEKITNVLPQPRLIQQIGVQGVVISEEITDEDIPSYLNMIDDSIDKDFNDIKKEYDKLNKPLPKSKDGKTLQTKEQEELNTVDVLYSDIGLIGVEIQKHVAPDKEEPLTSNLLNYDNKNTEYTLLTDFFIKKEFESLNIVYLIKKFKDTITLSSKRLLEIKVQNKKIIEYKKKIDYLYSDLKIIIGPELKKDSIKNYPNKKKIEGIVRKINTALDNINQTKIKRDEYYINLNAIISKMDSQYKTLSTEIRQEIKSLYTKYTTDIQEIEQLLDKNIKVLLKDIPVNVVEPAKVPGGNVIETTTSSGNKRGDIEQRKVLPSTRGESNITIKTSSRQNKEIPVTVPSGNKEENKQPGVNEGGGGENKPIVSSTIGEKIYTIPTYIWEDCLQELKELRKLLSKSKELVDNITNKPITEKEELTTYYSKIENVLTDKKKLKDLTKDKIEDLRSKGQQRIIMIKRIKEWDKQVNVMINFDFTTYHRKFNDIKLNMSVLSRLSDLPKVKGTLLTKSILLYKDGEKDIEKIEKLLNELETQNIQINDKIKEFYLQFNELCEMEIERLLKLSGPSLSLLGDIRKFINDSNTLNRLLSDLAKSHNKLIEIFLIESADYIREFINKRELITILLNSTNEMGNKLTNDDPVLYGSLIYQLYDLKSKLELNLTLTTPSPPDLNRWHLGDQVSWAFTRIIAIAENSFDFNKRLKEIQRDYKGIQRDLKAAKKGTDTKDSINKKFVSDSQGIIQGFLNDPNNTGLTEYISQDYIGQMNIDITFCKSLIEYFDLNTMFKDMVIMEYKKLSDKIKEVEKKRDEIIDNQGILAETAQEIRDLNKDLLIYSGVKVTPNVSLPVDAKDYKEYKVILKKVRDLINKFNHYSLRFYNKLLDRQGLIHSLASIRDNTFQKLIIEVDIKNEAYTKDWQAFDRSMVEFGNKVDKDLKKLKKIVQKSKMKLTDKTDLILDFSCFPEAAKLQEIYNQYANQPIPQSLQKTLQWTGGISAVSMPVEQYIAHFNQQYAFFQRYKEVPKYKDLFREYELKFLKRVAYIKSFQKWFDELSLYSDLTTNKNTINTNINNIDSKTQSTVTNFSELLYINDITKQKILISSISNLKKFNEQLKSTKDFLTKLKLQANDIENAYEAYRIPLQNLCGHELELLAKIRQPPQSLINKMTDFKSNIEKIASEILNINNFEKAFNESWKIDRKTLDEKILSLDKYFDSNKNELDIIENTLNADQLIDNDKTLLLAKIKQLKDHIDEFKKWRNMRLDPNLDPNTSQGHIAYYIRLIKFIIEYNTKEFKSDIKEIQKEYTKLKKKLKDLKLKENYMNEFNDIDFVSISNDIEQRLKEFTLTYYTNIKQYIGLKNIPKKLKFYDFTIKAINYFIEYKENEESRLNKFKAALKNLKNKYETLKISTSPDKKLSNDIVFIKSEYSYFKVIRSNPFSNVGLKDLYKDHIDELSDNVTYQFDTETRIFLNTILYQYDQVRQIHDNLPDNDKNKPSVKIFVDNLLFYHDPQNVNRDNDSIAFLKNPRPDIIKAIIKLLLHYNKDYVKSLKEKYYKDTNITIEDYNYITNLRYQDDKTIQPIEYGWYSFIDTRLTELKDSLDIIKPLFALNSIPRRLKFYDFTIKSINSFEKFVKNEQKRLTKFKSILSKLENEKSKNIENIDKKTIDYIIFVKIEIEYFKNTVVNGVITGDQYRDVITSKVDEINRNYRTENEIFLKIISDQYDKVEQEYTLASPGSTEQAKLDDKKKKLIFHEIVNPPQGNKPINDITVFLNLTNDDTIKIIIPLLIDYDEDYSKKEKDNKKKKGGTLSQVYSDYITNMNYTTQYNAIGERLINIKTKFNEIEPYLKLKNVPTRLKFYEFTLKYVISFEKFLKEEDKRLKNFNIIMNNLQYETSKPIEERDNKILTDYITTIITESNYFYGPDYGTNIDKKQGPIKEYYDSESIIFLKIINDYYKNLERKKTNTTDKQELQELDRKIERLLFYHKKGDPTKYINDIDRFLKKKPKNTIDDIIKLLIFYDKEDIKKPKELNIPINDYNKWYKIIDQRIKETKNKVISISKLYQFKSIPKRLKFYDFTIKKIDEFDDFVKDGEKRLYKFKSLLKKLEQEKTNGEVDKKINEDLILVNTEMSYFESNLPGSMSDYIIELNSKHKEMIDKYNTETPMFLSIIDNYRKKLIDIKKNMTVDQNISRIDELIKTVTFYDLNNDITEFMKRDMNINIPIIIKLLISYNEGDIKKIEKEGIGGIKGIGGNNEINIINDNITEAKDIQNVIVSLLDKMDYIKNYDINQIRRSDIIEKIQLIKEKKDLIDYKNINKRMVFDALKNNLNRIVKSLGIILNTYQYRTDIEYRRKLDLPSQQKLMDEIYKIKTIFDDEFPKEFKDLINEIWNLIKIPGEIDMNDIIVMTAKQFSGLNPGNYIDSNKYFLMYPIDVLNIFIPIYLIFQVLKDDKGILKIEPYIKISFSYKKFVKKLTNKNRLIRSSYNNITLDFTKLPPLSDHNIQNMNSFVIVLTKSFYADKEPIFNELSIERLVNDIIKLYNNTIGKSYKFYEYPDERNYDNTHTHITRLKDLSEEYERNFQFANYKFKNLTNIRQNTDYKKRTLCKFQNIFDNKLIINDADTLDFIIYNTIIYLSLQNRPINAAYYSVFGLNTLTLIECLLNLSTYFKITISHEIEIETPGPGLSTNYYSFISSPFIIKFVPDFDNNIILYSYPTTLDTHNINDIVNSKKFEIITRDGQYIGCKKDVLFNKDMINYILDYDSNDIFYDFLDIKFEKRFIVDEDHIIWIMIDNIYQPKSFQFTIGDNVKIEDLKQDRIMYSLYTKM